MLAASYGEAIDEICEDLRIYRQLDHAGVLRAVKRTSCADRLLAAQMPAVSHRTPTSPLRSRSRAASSKSAAPSPWSRSTARSGACPERAAGLLVVDEVTRASAFTAKRGTGSATFVGHTRSSGERYPTTTAGDEIAGFSFRAAWLDRNDPEQHRLNLIDIEGLFAR